MVQLFHGVEDFSSFRRQALRAVGKKFGFDLMTPINKIKPKHLEIILHGTDDLIDFKYRSKSGDSSWQYTDAFEGVLSNLQRVLWKLILNQNVNG